MTPVDSWAGDPAGDERDGSATVHDLLGAYAVDALDDDERTAFEAHLADCRVCAAELIDLREALAELAATVALDPPAHLRSRVLGGVSATEPATAPPTAPLPDEGKPDEREPAALEIADRGTGESALAPVHPLRPPGSPTRRALFAAAAAGVAVVGGGVVWRMARRSGPGEVTADEVLAAADAKRSSAPLTGGGSATVIRSARLDRAVLQLRSVPAPASGRTYQAWLARPDGSFASAGLLPAGADVSLLLQGDPATASGVGVTDEPAGGSPQPTTKPIALVTMPA